MFFNSLDFAWFLPLVFTIYWLVGNWDLRLRNLLIVVASYYFYGCWDPRFLGLIVFSTLVDYLIGNGLKGEGDPFGRKCLLWLSILVNIGLLGVFKYYDFFLDNFTAAFSFLGYQVKGNTLNIILPVGISFYTFQTLSYTIDVYRRKLEPVQDFLAYAAYVSFFPQLVAGPIERATHLIPQFKKLHKFDYDRAVDGLRQILWGLFKKIVVADNCAHFANKVFNNPDDFNGASIALGVLAFTFQIYGDFSGYSDIAIGTSRLFGFDLKKNFAFPYFARDIAEFWRRWHISLSTWFRDYLYIPLGGSRGSKWQQIRNVFIIFLVSGFWHGANWTFVAWGLLHAIYFLPLLLGGRNRNNLDVVAADRFLPSPWELLQMLTTFTLVSLAWVFFRAETVADALGMLGKVFSTSLFEGSSLIPGRLSIAVGIFLLIEWIGRREEYAIAATFRNWPRVIRWAFYLLLASAILIYQGPKQGFIYFQF